MKEEWKLRRGEGRIRRSEGRRGARSGGRRGEILQSEAKRKRKGKYERDERK